MNNYTDRFKDAPWFEGSKKETILVGGVGGIGSNMLYYMAKTVPAKYYIFDMDTVDSHNIGTQFFQVDQVGKLKVTAMYETLRSNGITSVTYFNTKLTGNPLDIAPITIAAFDNMEARKQLFDVWKTQSNRELFIDGRLSANIYQVFVVIPGREEWYEKTLFNDADVADGPCTFKQTAYFAGLIGARMTHVLVNHLSNKYMGEEICNVPFLIEENGDPFVIKTYYNYEDLQN